ncbi:lipopolysaccharide biosynthesis protein [Aliihoeflea sp. PC F10.4]
MAIKRFVLQLTTSRFIRAISILASAAAIGQFVMVAAMPLLTRIYTPDDFGLFALFGGISAAILVISSLRYEIAIPLNKKEINARSVLILSLFINLLISIVAFLLILIWRRAIEEWFAVDGIANLLLLLPIVVFCGGCYKALNYWAIRQSDFRAIAHTRIAQGIAYVIAQLAGGLLGWGAFGLAVGQLFGFAAGTFRLARGANLQAINFMDENLRRRMRGLARRHSNFPKFDVPGSLVDVVGVQLPNVLLAAVFSAPVAGFYLVADRVLSAPLSLVGQAVGQVLYSRGGEGARSGELGRLATKVAMVLGVLSIPPAILLFFVGEHIFAIIFGKMWGQAGTFASYMIIGICVQFIYSSISVVLMATDGQRVNLVVHSTVLLGKLAAFIVGSTFSSPILTVALISIVNSIGYGLSIFVIINHANNYYLENRKV